MLHLDLLPDRLAIYRLAAGDPAPAWVAGGFTSITRTAGELSIVCAEGVAPAGTRCEPGWRVLRVAGPLDFGLTGIFSSLAGPLADAGVSLFALSTFDTDYVMVKEEHLEKAMAALRAAGHSVAAG